MSNKEEEILNEIINYYKKNKNIPSIRYLKDKVNLKSTSTIHYHLNNLEKYGYLKRNELNKRILNNNYNDYENGLKIIKVINSNENIKVFLDNNNYIAYKVENNYLIKNNILKNDILIIKKKSKLKNNDLGLFKINKKYYIMKYFYQDGFYILESDIKRYYEQVNIIGKVVYLERKIKRD